MIFYNSLFFSLQIPCVIVPIGQNAHHVRGLSLIHILGLDGRKVDEAYVNDIIATLGIEKRIYNLPNQLSGGQQQRVAIARALVNRPEIIFADEPTGNLDSKTSDEVIALLKMTAKKYGQTIVMITHDDEIAQVADRIPVSYTHLSTSRSAPFPTSIVLLNLEK